MIGVSVTTGVLLAVLVGGSTQVERLDLVRTALTVGAGAGALVTLLYAIRRQLLGEQAADDARMDAKEKRVTELYVKGIEQFSSERAVAKIGGLYALEKLADDEPRMREVVVNVWCAYLRDDGAASTEEEHVREAVQASLVDHLAYESRFAIHKTHWGLLMIVLSGARLERGYFRSLRVDTAHFTDVTFCNTAEFDDSEILGANFSRVTYEGDASFDGVRFYKGIFHGSHFNAKASFDGALFLKEVDFADCTFSQDPTFDNARVRVVEGGQVTLPPGWMLVDVGADGSVPDGQEGQWGKITKGAAQA